MKMKVIFIMAVGAGLLAGCGSSASSSSEPDEAAAKRKAEGLVGGTAGVVTPLDEGEKHRWVVDVKMANGAMIRVEMERRDSAVTNLYGSSGPFDYDFAGPESGYLGFAEARGKALAQKAGSVEEWEIDVGKTQYELYVRNADQHLFEIKLDARSGAVRSVEEKDKAD